LSGRGGDEIFAMELLFPELRRAPRASQLRGAAALWAAGRRPPLGLRATWARRPRALAPPAWLDQRWVRDLRLVDRLASLDGPAPPGPRARARQRLESVRCSAGFDYSADAYGGLECRYPLMDHRVVSFALRLPPFPWCVDKYLLRRALAGRLPTDVLARGKTFLGGEPLLAWVESNPGWHAGQATPSLPHGVHAAEWRRAWSEPIPKSERGVTLWSLARALALARWEALRADCAPLPAVA
jgi:asparagine synthase (glutamine-hydrolysing)